MSPITLDYAALSAISLFFFAYTAIGGWAVSRWAATGPTLGWQGGAPRGLLVAGALLPQLLVPVQLRAIGSLKPGDALWLVPGLLLLVVALGATGALTALAWHLRADPRVSKWRRIATLVALFALGTAAAFLVVQFRQQRVFEGTDSPAYDVLGLNWSQGLGLTFGSEGTSLVGKAPYVPTMHREPLYPAYVAVHYVLFGAGSWNPVAWTQTLLVGALAVLAYFAARQVFGEAAGVLAGLLTGMSPDHADLARQIMTESLYVPVLVSAAVCGLLAVRTGRTRWFVLAGAGFALAALVRVFASVFFPVMLVVWLVFAWRRGGREALKPVALAGAAFFVVLAPWVARNAVEFGVPLVAGRHGSQFLPRALKSAAPPEMYVKWTRAALYVVANPYSELVYPIRNFQYGKEDWDNDVWDFHVNDANAALRQGLRSCDGMDFVQEEDCQTRVAMSTVLTHLPQYVLQTPFEFVKFNFYPLPSALSAYRNTLVWVSLVSAFVFLFRRRLNAPGVWLFLLLGTYVGVGVQVDAWERHAVPLLPLYYAFAAAGMLGASTALAAKWMRRAVPRESQHAPLPASGSMVHDGRESTAGLAHETNRAQSDAAPTAGEAWQRRGVPEAS